MSKCPSPTSTDPYTEPETFDSGTGGICGCLTLVAVVIVVIVVAYALLWTQTGGNMSGPR